MNVDIIIVGGGIVGACFALQLEQSGLQVAVIDQTPPAVTALDGDYDHRVYAVTPANVGMLETLGIFQPTDRARFTPIQTMEIFGDRGAKLMFSAREAHCDQLAMMIEYRLLAQRLTKRLLDAAHVQYFSSTRPTTLHLDENVSLIVDDGTEINASLLVGADGVKSWVRNETGFSVTEKDYEQIAVVANFRCEKPHGSCARQWFDNGSILAWLPLGTDIISIVWSLPSARAQEITSLSEMEFCHVVQNAGANALGTMQLVSPIAQFPLASLRSDRLVVPQVALIGDAGHGVHPLAGQGLNLGLQDATILAKKLMERSNAEGVGDIAVLRRYERSRKEALARMHYVTDGLQRLFGMKSMFASSLRSSGLTIVNGQRWLKNMLVQHAIG